MTQTDRSILGVIKINVTQLNQVEHILRTIPHEDAGRRCRCGHAAVGAKRSKKRAMRFFFDYTKRDESLFDYRGDEFLSPKSAIDFAHAIAQHLKNSLSEDWLGWNVEVRDAEGSKLYAVAVDAIEAMVA